MLVALLFNLVVLGLPWAISRLTQETFEVSRLPQKSPGVAHR
jgi:hypothetical protein